MGDPRAMRQGASTVCFLSMCGALVAAWWWSSAHALTMAAVFVVGWLVVEAMGRG